MSVFKALEACLSPDEQKAQAARCSCRGADDYCPCQNVADAQTKRDRGFALPETSISLAPFSTYPEQRVRLLELARLIQRPNTDEEDTLKAADTLSDLVIAILEDEARA